MYELEQVGENSFYLNCPAKIGLYRLSNVEVVLIDSGNDKDAGRKVRQLLDQQGWKLRAIVNTHSNADHIGGNQYLQKQTGCAVFANGIEAAFTKNPILEPSFLYGGYPCKELRHKFLMAQGSRVKELTDPDFPTVLKTIPLPGHFFDMVGFRTPDNVVYLADCLSSRATLEKYGIPFIYDVGAYLKTLDMVEAMEAAVFVPSHAEAAADIRELARFNREKVLQIGETLLAICAAPVSFETVLQETFDRYGLVMDFEQYALVGSTVRSYLAYWKDAGRLDAAFTGNRLLWQRRD